MTDEEIRLSMMLPARLHRGEAACLCMARVRRWGFLTDDRAARQQAVAWDIPLSGTIGVLLRAIRLGKLIVAQGNVWLQEMISRANYCSRTTDLEKLLS